MRANNIRGTSCFVRTVLLFVMHQIIGTEGVTWLVVLGAFLLTTTVGAVSEAWAHSALMRAMHVVLKHTFLSSSGSCRSILRMETLPSLGASFDALGLDSTVPRAHLRCHRDSDL